MAGRGPLASFLLLAIASSAGIALPSATLKILRVQELEAYLQQAIRTAASSPSLWGGQFVSHFSGPTLMFCLLQPFGA